MATYKRKPPEERFWKYVNKTEDCWLWTGAKGRAGHGQFGVDYKSTTAHRWSYIFHKGSIPDGLYVCHTCDVPNCVNPDHLFLGTPKDNMQDMYNKGRSYSQNKTHCVRGHLFSGENLYVSSSGLRACRTCRREMKKKWNQKQKIFVSGEYVTA